MILGGEPETCQHIVTVIGKNRPKSISLTVPHRHSPVSFCLSGSIA